MAFQRGDQIVYVPDHAASSDDPDCELGFVTSVKGDNVFCRFWFRDRPGILRTLSSSEIAQPGNLVLQREPVIIPGQIEVILAFIESGTPIVAWCERCKIELDWRKVPEQWHYDPLFEAWRHKCAKHSESALPVESKGVRGRKKLFLDC